MTQLLFHPVSLFSDFYYLRAQTWEKYSIELTEATNSEPLLNKWQWST